MTLTVVERAAPSSERELVAACVAGDASAQRTLFRREFDRVSATVFRIVGSTRDCDDLVQETFIAVFRGLHRFRGDAKLSTWIDRIAIRVVFQHLRGLKKRPTIPLDLVGDVAGDDGALSERVHARDGLRRLYGALAALAPEGRVAFALYAVDGRTIPEVATIMGTTVVTAKLRIWRARKRVHAALVDDPVLAELVRVADGREDAS